MPKQRLVIEVHGLPAPQGSKRHVGKGVMIESSKAVKPWRQDVKFAALRALEETPGWDVSATSLALHVVFTLPRPRSHYRTGRFAHLLRDDAPALHSSKPDLDKLLRSVGDALTSAGVYADDSRVAQVWSVKAYASTAARPNGVLPHPGARITLSPVGARP